MTKDQKYMMIYYWSIQINDVLIHTSTWIDLESIMPGERSQSQKSTYVKFCLEKMSRDIFSDRNYISGFQGLREGEKKCGCEWV